MKRKLLLIAFFIGLFLMNNSQAQNYNSAIGGKLGYGLIASYKKLLNDNAAIDIFGDLRWGGLAAGAYYEIHKDIASVDRLQWYFGGGASFTTWRYESFGFADENYFELGISGVLGLDYSFDNIPLNLSVDWAPTFVVYDTWDFAGSYNRFRSGYGAFTARYILN
ncbi:MAG: hypothetical protein IPF52_11950 [Saprospiraceae bacterium]|nr:hypothetical protein [Saprospiraceae bacterium]